MWFPKEVFAHIKDYLLDYKKTFSKNILTLISREKAVDISTIGPVFGSSNLTSINIFKINYKVPRYSSKNMSESRLNKLGLTHYGPRGLDKDEKVYTYLNSKKDWLELDGYCKSWYYNSGN